MVRLNQVMRRVRLAPLPDAFIIAVAGRAKLVAERKRVAWTEPRGSGWPGSVERLSLQPVIPTPMPG